MRTIGEKGRSFGHMVVDALELDIAAAARVSPVVI